MNGTERALFERNRRVSNWRFDLADRLERKFDATRVTNAQDPRNESLYVTRDDAHSSVRLFYGSHPVGAKLQGHGTATESNAQLVVSQAVDGTVVVFLYPYESVRLKRTEKHITWDVFRQPEDLTNAKIDAAIDDFQRYSRVSSALDGGSRSDRRRIERLIKRSARFGPSEGNDKVRPLGWWHRVLHSRLVLTVGFLSAIATLSGFTVPQIWDHLRNWYHKPKVAIPAPAEGTATRNNETRATADMPLIEGHYTLCPVDPLFKSSPAWLNFAYDIDANVGRTVFLDVAVQIECLTGRVDGEPAQERYFGREVRGDTLVYTVHTLPLFAESRQHEIAAMLDGPRDISRLPEVILDNGASIRIRGDRDGRNALSRLQINVEGMNDIIYGPYIVKRSVEDAAVDFELSPAFLDSAAEAAASVVDRARRSGAGAAAAGRL